MKKRDKSDLTPWEQFITQQKGTEPAFDNPYWNKHDKGIYVDINTGEPLFSSDDKYDSGCGWPSFTKPIESSKVNHHPDLSHGMVRTEVTSKSSNNHLGHVFNDGPKEGGGKRYCINSASIRFIPEKDMEAEGYGDYLPKFVEK